MKNKLVFFRHAKAVRPDYIMNDWDRPLTDKGRNSMETVVPKLRLILEGNPISAIWSSPKVRASQTAEILADGLGVDEIRYVDAIAYGEETLFSEIKALEPPFCLFIVGHEPDLSRWVEDLTDISVDLKTSEGICVVIENCEERTGNLEWITEKSPLEIRYKGQVQRQAESILIFYLQEIRLALHRFFKEPENPDERHKFRVKVRQFRSLLTFFRPLLNKSKAREMEEKLAGAAEMFGDLRDLDVLIETWEGLEEDEDGRSPLTRRMKKEREVLLASLITEASRKELFERIRCFEDLLVDDFWGGEGAYLSLETFCDRRFHKWEREIEEQWKGLDWNDGSKVHQLRIRIKRMRYVLALLLPEDRGSAVSQWIDWQDCFGELLDAEVGQRILEEWRPFHEGEKEYDLLMDYLARRRKDRKEKASLTRGRKASTIGGRR